MRTDIGRANGGTMLSWDAALVFGAAVFAWLYFTGRPEERVVAMVIALAALAYLLAKHVN